MKVVTAPVFYDRTGKRLRHLIEATCVLVLIIAVLVACMVPAMIAPTWPTAINSDSGFARRFLAAGDPHNVPIIGEDEGALTRVVRVVHEHTGTGTPPRPVAPPPVDPGYWALEENFEPPEPETMPPLKLVDPITNEFLRYATEIEREDIGDSPYAIEHFGRPADHTLMLTFDDGPDATYTPQLLDLPAREHVPATFFIIGKAVVKNPEVLKRTIREGHMGQSHHDAHRLRSRERFSES